MKKEMVIVSLIGLAVVVYAIVNSQKKEDCNCQDIIRNYQDCEQELIYG
jgi:hypothetical protein